jgi:hypothetical protein
MTELLYALQSVEKSGNKIVRRIEKMNKKQNKELLTAIEGRTKIGEACWSSVYGELKYGCLKYYKGKEKEFILDVMRYIEENYESEKEELKTIIKTKNTKWGKNWLAQRVK